MQSTHAGPSQPLEPRPISGTTPGLLDSTQPERLLRRPGSTLSFASFHPLAASSGHDISNVRNRSIHEELYRPKRVVIEQTPGSTGGSFWRFVPRARWAQGVENEGSWPRIIELCGEYVYCSQDQWDIYKLDPEYDCLVNTPPRMTVISRKKNKEHATSQNTPPHPQHASPTTPRTGKRRLSSPETPTLRKRLRSVIIVSDDSMEDPDDDVQDASDGEEDEVEEIIVDGHTRIRHTHPASHKTAKSSFEQERRRRQEATEENRRARREKNAAKTRPFTSGPAPDQEMIDLTMESDSSQSQSGTHAHAAKPPSPAKRKASPLNEARPRTGGLTTGDASRVYDGAGQSTKRMRHMSPPSPTATKRTMQEKRAEREKRRAAQFHERVHRWSLRQQEEFISRLMADVPVYNCKTEAAPPESKGWRSYGQPPSPPDRDEWDSHQAAPSPPESSGWDSYRAAPPPSGWDEQPHHQPESLSQEMDAEVLHQAAIMESRRKLAELERDRPLWEAAARRRHAEQRAAEAARRAQREAEELRAAQERHRRAVEEELRRQHAARARAEQERRAEQQRQQHTRWSYGPWTAQRALEHHKLLCETFDAAKFTAENPVSFAAVPWPVLRSPGMLKVEDIDWSAVEAFFHAVKGLMRSQDYKVFIEKNHKRFHPDRWRARSVLKSIQDDQLRDCMDVAANTVAQALTPLWREVKDS